MLNEEEEDEEERGSSHQLHDVSQHEGEGGKNIEHGIQYTVYRRFSTLVTFVNNSEYRIAGEINNPRVRGHK